MTEASTSFSLYQLQTSAFGKTLCQLIAKAYKTGENVCVYVLDEETLNQLDAQLWTYAEKEFIPHGTMLDEFPDKQPVYITMNIDESDTPNNAQVAVIVCRCRGGSNAELGWLGSYLSSQKIDDLSKNDLIYGKVCKYKKVIVVFEETNLLEFNALKDIITASSHLKLSCYAQQSDLSWQTLSFA